MPAAGALRSCYARCRSASTLPLYAPGHAPYDGVGGTMGLELRPCARGVCPTLIAGLIAAVAACDNDRQEPAVDATAGAVDSAPGTVDSAQPGADGPPLPALVFFTTFDCADWDQTLGLGDANVCVAG